MSVSLAVLTYLDESDSKMECDSAAKQHPTGLSPSYNRWRLRVVETSKRPGDLRKQ